MCVTLEVGKLFVPGVTRYQEGVRFDFTPFGANLIVFYFHPTSKVIQRI